MWDLNNQFVNDEHGQIFLDKENKPELGFQYDSIVYHDVDKTKWVINPDGFLTECSIESQECEAIEKFIDAKRDEFGVRVHAVDGQGLYLGYIKTDDPRLVSAVTPPPNGDHYYWDFDKKDWIFIRAVDERGAYVGNVPFDQAVHLVESPPIDPVNERWSFLEEKYIRPEPSIDELKRRGEAQLDDLKQVRKVVIDALPDGSTIHAQINEAVAAVLEQNGHPLLAKLQRARRTVLQELHTATTGQEIDGIDAGVKVIRLEVEAEYGVNR